MHFLHPSAQVRNLQIAEFKTLRPVCVSGVQRLAGHRAPDPQREDDGQDRELYVEEVAEVKNLVQDMISRVDLKVPTSTPPVMITLI